MNMKKLVKILLLACLTATVATGGLVCYRLYRDFSVQGPLDFEGLAKGHPRVLVVCCQTGRGGKAVSALNQYRQLLNAGVPALLLTSRGCAVHEMANELNLPVVVCSPISLGFGIGVKHAVRKLARRFTFDIIHCHNRREVRSMHQLLHGLLRPWAERRPRLIYTNHEADTPTASLVERCDVVVCVNQRAVSEIQQMHLNKLTGDRRVLFIPEFFDEERFINFTPNPLIDRKQAMHEAFGITLLDCPVIAKVAQFYRHLEHKNHPVLLRAVKLLVSTGRPVQVILAGEGESQAHCERLAERLGIRKYLHFIGSTPQTPLLLHYADINVLASANEAGAIVLQEGGLMKKPTIISDRIGSSNLLIFDHVTGLLFKNDDEQDLARAIGELLSKPDLARRVGEALYDLVRLEFSNEASVAKLLKVYAAATQSLDELASAQRASHSNPNNADVLP